MIYITMPELRDAINTISMIEKRGLSAELSAQIGGLWTYAETVMASVEDPSDNEQVLELDIEPIPFSQIKNSIKGETAWPSMFKGAIRKFMDFEK